MLPEAARGPWARDGVERAERPPGRGARDGLTPGIFPGVGLSWDERREIDARISRAKAWLESGEGDRWEIELPEGFFSHWTVREGRTVLVLAREPERDDTEG